jgi:GNAT superfamily N-acetyltransferase
MWNDDRVYLYEKGKLKIYGVQALDEIRIQLRESHFKTNAVVYSSTQAACVYSQMAKSVLHTFLGEYQLSYIPILYVARHLRRQGVATNLLSKLNLEKYAYVAICQVVYGEDELQRRTPAEYVNGRRYRDHSKCLPPTPEEILEMEQASMALYQKLDWKALTLSNGTKSCLAYLNPHTEAGAAVWSALVKFVTESGETCEGTV